MVEMITIIFFFPHSFIQVPNTFPTLISTGVTNISKEDVLCSHRSVLGNNVLYLINAL